MKLFARLHDRISATGQRRLSGDDIIVTFRPYPVFHFALSLSDSLSIEGNRVHRDPAIMPATALDASIGLIELVSASGLVSRLSGKPQRFAILLGNPIARSGRPVSSLIDIPEGDNRKYKKNPSQCQFIA